MDHLQVAAKAAMRRSPPDQGLGAAAMGRLPEPGADEVNVDTIRESVAQLLQLASPRDVPLLGGGANSVNKDSVQGSKVQQSGQVQGREGADTATDSAPDSVNMDTVRSSAVQQLKQLKAGSPGAGEQLHGAAGHNEGQHSQWVQQGRALAAAGEGPRASARQAAEQHGWKRSTYTVSGSSHPPIHAYSCVSSFTPTPTPAYSLSQQHC